jgi:hypothetical protein
MTNIEESIESLMSELEELADSIDEKKIVINNQLELLKVDNSIQEEHIKLVKEVNSLMMQHHLLFIQLAHTTGDKYLLKVVKETDEGLTNGLKELGCI